MLNRQTVSMLVFASCLSLAFVAPGCSGGDDGMKPENVKALTDANSIAKRVDGNYDKLTADEKQTFLKMANNSEANARNIVKMMAHPPNEMLGHHAGGPGSPPGK